MPSVCSITTHPTPTPTNSPARYHTSLVFFGLRSLINLLASQINVQSEHLLVFCSLVILVCQWLTWLYMVEYKGLVGICVTLWMVEYKGLLGDLSQGLSLPVADLLVHG